MFLSIRVPVVEVVENPTWLLLQSRWLCRSSPREVYLNTLVSVKASHQQRPSGILVQSVLCLDLDTLPWRDTLR